MIKSWCRRFLAYALACWQSRCVLSTQAFPRVTRFHLLDGVALTHLACPCASAAAHKHSDSPSSPSPSPSSHDPHHHHHHAVFPSHQPPAPDSNRAHHHCHHCRYSPPTRYRQAHAACGRYSTLSSSSFPFLRCRLRLLPIGFAFGVRVARRGDGGLGWGCWGRRRWRGWFGSRGWRWVLRCQRSLLVGLRFAGGRTFRRCVVNGVFDAAYRDRKS